MRSVLEAPWRTSMRFSCELRDRAVHGAVEAVKGRGSDDNQGGDVAAERQTESDAMPVSGYTTSSDKANQEVWVVLQFDL